MYGAQVSTAVHVRWLFAFSMETAVVGQYARYKILNYLNKAQRTEKQINVFDEHRQWPKGVAF